MKDILKFAHVFVTVLIVHFASGYVFMSYWNWFITDLSGLSITLIHAVAIFSCIALLKVPKMPSVDILVSHSTINNAFALNLVRVSFTLALGWSLSLFL